MEWNNAQKEAIKVRNKNILVSAAAGSGKTAVLVERIKQLIILDHIEIDEMLIVTFTNAAAMEMKEKISNAIADEIDKGGENERFLRTQLAKINSVNISTFHAFCMEVIRRYFYLTDVSPDFKICDEIQRDIFQTVAMDELFEEMFEAQDDEFYDFLNQYAMSSNEKSIRDMIAYTCRFIQSLPEPYEWLSEKIEELNQDVDSFKAGKVFSIMWEEIGANIKRALDYFRLARTELEEANLLLLANLEKSEELQCQELLAVYEQTDYELLRAKLNSTNSVTLRASKAEKEAYEDIKEKVKNSRDSGKLLLKSISENFLNQSLEEQVKRMQLTYNAAKSIYKLSDRFNQLYCKKKNEKGLLDFNDIEHEALKILNFKETQNEYREKFKYVFIDEYQDSNVVQEALIDRVKGKNNLFMVGDVKQSIYKFRLAEPGIFLKKYEDYKIGKDPESIKIDLNKNFRSKDGIIDVVNLIFSKIMTKDTAEMDYDEDAWLYPGIKYEQSKDYKTELHIIDERKLIEEETDAEILDMKKAELEATIAAKIINDTVGKDIFDQKLGKIRAVTYSDIVVLFRAYVNYAEAFEEIFKKEGIPVYAEGGDGYFDTLEIGVFSNLLKVIDNKQQDIPLLSVLRSAIIGFTLEELALIRAANPKGLYAEAFLKYSTSGVDINLREKTTEVLEKIYKWREEAKYMPLSEFLWKLATETGYYDYIGALPAGNQRTANIRMLIDKAEAYQEDSTKGLYGFLQYIEQMKKSKAKLGEVKILGEKDNLVRLMTVHKSKGLEFPVVIVAGMGKRFNRSKESGNLAFHRAVGIGMSYQNADAGYYAKTLRQKIIDSVKGKEELAEEMRILYVALTRAKDKLVLLGTTKNSVEELIEKRKNIEAGNCYLDWVFPPMHDEAIKTSENIQIFEHDRASISNTKQEEVLKTYELKNGLEKGFLIGGKDAVEIGIKVNERLNYNYGFSSAVKIPSKFSVSDIRKMNLNQENHKEDFVPKLQNKMRAAESDYTFSAAERGTITHKVLQYIDFKATRTLEEINEKISEMVKKEILTEKEKDQVYSNWIYNLISSPIGKRMTESAEVYKEKSFNLIKKAEELFCDISDGESEIIIQGTIDCFFKDGDGWVLVDYKTDYLPQKATLEEITEKAEPYREQIKLYKEALEKNGEYSLKEVYIYFLSNGHAVAM